MKVFIKPKYQYFLLLLVPLPFVFIGTIAMINFMINRKHKIAISILIVISIISFIFIIVIPSFLKIIDNNILIEFLYTYIISVIIGIYTIRIQNKVLYK